MGEERKRGHGGWRGCVEWKGRRPRGILKLVEGAVEGEGELTEGVLAAAVKCGALHTQLGAERVDAAGGAGVCGAVRV